MLKNILIVFCLLISSFIYAANDFDKNIIIHNQTRDDKVKSVFKELMKYYEDEDETGFFSLISEDRFLQDFMLFEQAIEKDFRTYEILDFDYWIDKITSDGVKRYLYVKWEKRYELINGNNELTQRGYSRFLFDEINGKYKLIELAGNNLWGNSLAEWKEEIPHISGEEQPIKKAIQDIEQTSDQENEEAPDQGESGETEPSGQPDLIVINVTCTDTDNFSTSYVSFYIKNQGAASTQNSYISWSATNGSEEGNGEYDGDLAAGETSEKIIWENNYYCSDGSVTVDPNNSIAESDENNNETTFNGNSGTQNEERTPTNFK